MSGPESPWSEIRPGLWMGGHEWFDPSGELVFAVVADEFDLVISLFTRNGHGPGPGVDHRVNEVPDAPLRAGQIGQVRALAAVAADAVRRGRRTLVRCRSGYNRSGLVVAQALIDLGADVDEAITLIRRRRSPHALNNEVFVAYLRTGLDVAQLLSGLDAPA